MGHLLLAWRGLGCPGRLHEMPARSRPTGVLYPVLLACLVGWAGLLLPRSTSQSQPELNADETLHMCVIFLTIVDSF